MINHRYTIVRPLGSGGSGSVFLCEDTLEANSRCAVKVFHTAPGAEFHAEVTLLQSFHHPHLVPILNAGTVLHAELPDLVHHAFFSMAYVQGEDLLRWASASPGPLRSGMLLAILLQLLDVLGYIHRAGVVHYDIKPENVLVGRLNDQLSITVMDFGFSRVQSVEGLPDIRGTLHYTAPEMLRGEPTGVAADLYSLGATLFHVIEGRPPFVAGDPVGLVKTILGTEPAFSGHRGEPILDALKDIALLLMTKDPAARPGSTDDVLQKLRRALGDRIPDRNPLRVAARCVGRRVEKESLAELLGGKHGSSAGSRVAVVTGTEGIGKTMLCAEAARLARMSGMPVYQIPPAAATIEGIDHLLNHLLADAQSIGVDDAAIRRFGEVRAFPARGGMEEKDERWALMCARLLIDTSRSLRFAIVVDDLHKHEAVLQEMLAAIEREDEERRIALIVTIPEGDGPFFQPLRIHLRELPADEVGEMCSLTFGHSVGVRIGRTLYRQYGGVPAFIVQAMHVMNPGNAGAGADAAVQSPETMAMPEGVDGVLTARVARLPELQREILRVLSCFHLPAHPAIPGTVLSSAGTEEAVVQLRAGELVSVSTGGRLSIRQQRLRAIVYAGIPSPLLLHVRIATLLEHMAERHPDDEECALQFQDAGETTSAKKWFLQGARHAAALSAHGRAARLYAGALALDKQDLSTAVRYADALARSGRFQEAIDLAETMIETLGEDDPLRPAAARTIGFACSRLGDFPRARLHLQSAVGGKFSPTEHLELRQELVGVDIALGNYRDAEESSLGHLKTAESLNNPTLVASIHTDLGIATFLQEKWEASLRHFQRSLETFALLEDKMKMANGLINIGNVLSARGEDDQAVETWTRALDLSREEGTLGQQSQILNNLGIVHYKRDRLEDARECYEKARALAEKEHSRAGIAYARTNLGEVAFAECDYESALNLWRAAHATYELMGDARGRAESLLQIAQVLVVIGNVEDAGTALDDARAIISGREIDALRMQEAFVSGMHAMAMNNPEAGAGFFGKAADLARHAGEERLVVLSTARLALACIAMGNVSRAGEILRGIAASVPVAARGHALAEVYLVLGMIELMNSGSPDASPLSWLKKGYEEIEKRHVGEVTWKLAAALAREYKKRGNSARAREVAGSAQVVIRHFSSLFLTDSLRERYLQADRRVGVLEEMEEITR